MIGDHSQRGFTLIELVVTLAIFAVFASLAYGGLRHTLKAKDTLTEHQDAIAGLGNTFSLIENDFMNVVARGARGALGDPIPALFAPPDIAAIEFTRYVDDSYSTQPVTRLSRVGYELRGGRLVRLTWPVLDRVQATVPKPRVLLEGVESVSFRFNDGHWSEFWPPSSNDHIDDELPRAIELTVNFHNGKSARRIVMLENDA